MTYLAILGEIFSEHANTLVAAQQRSYMKDNFSYYGLKTPLRRMLTKLLLETEALPEKTELDNIIYDLWSMPEREYQMFGLDLALKFRKQLAPQDLILLEFMVTNKSWWDTVDFIATNLMSSYFQTYPDQISSKITEWLESGNIWLQRCALLFQLKWKHDLDTKLLTRCIQQLNGTSEFFLNKAIGWVLREYSKTDAAWVIRFVANNKLHPLSKREALRLIKK